jgi:hypothetical protein
MATLPVSSLQHIRGGATAIEYALLLAPQPPGGAQSAIAQPVSLDDDPR